MKRALISGITGQDGRYLSEHLARHDYTVYGLVHGQRNPMIATCLSENSHLHILEGDLTDLSSLIAAVETSQPDEVYNLAAISHVGMSFNQPELTAQVTGLGAVRLMQAVRMAAPNTRMYQASTSEMYGNYITHIDWERISESTPFNPVSPYGAAKLYAHSMAHVYRDSYNIPISCGILFNHESPRRGPEFVTQKIVKGLIRAIETGDKLHLGNISAVRDWGHAADYTRAMHLMLQQDTPGDYIIATGVPHSVRDVLDNVASQLNISWEDHVIISAREQRPTDINFLCGDPTLAMKTLNWEPTYTFETLLREMVSHG